MEYTELAVDFLNKMQSLNKEKAHKSICDSLQGEAFILHYISLHDDYVLPSEISHEMGVSTARIAQALNSIEKKGWITRQIDKTDRRQILVGMTEEGMDAAERHQQAVVVAAAKILELLGEHDAKEHIRILGRLAEIASMCSCVSNSVYT